jgi:hypothetical protein
MQVRKQAGRLAMGKPVKIMKARGSLTSNDFGMGQQTPVLPMLSPGHILRDDLEIYVKGEGVYGIWECACGALTKTGFYDATWADCGRCRKKASTYKEFTVYDHNAGVVGNPDFLIDIGGVMYIVEIKSMNPEDFDELESPKPDHIYQAAGYRRLMNVNDFDVAPQVIIIYCTKKFKYGSPYKEFHVNVDKEPINAVLDNAWGVAEHIRESRKKATIPTEKICKNSSSPAARNCPHVTDCMGGGR